MTYPVKREATFAWSNTPSPALQAAPAIVVVDAAPRVEGASAIPTTRRACMAATDALALCMLDSALGG